MAENGMSLGDALVGGAMAAKPVTLQDLLAAFALNAVDEG